ncbi:histidine phosphatase family protein [Halalkalibacillus halophilus]|uniref:histidine phosphatase family protein n=1 Tax=Halalkalibacillus halophilus TaxID=392827 RepID=UPI0004116448|nr:histidine phosphatase family protein [Halalkalibacillus halophilus]
MTQTIYIVRHCEATGQDPEAELTEQGADQANELVKFFEIYTVDRIISSPYIRAIQSIKPLSEALNVNVEVDNRLAERALSSNDLPDWKEKLEATFDDLDLKFEGGESNREALTRGREVIEEAFENDVDGTVLVSHGGIISILLSHYGEEFGFLGFESLTNPDVYALTFHNKEINIKRIWEE